ncbi:hypothetical protein PSEUBRA_005977 [Kalmanozyma brasiliensis GHG001]|uniref:uncharacterized protein n=1 Tax=Kalmanozyma brasiliensis (strain GHG001) TaxID=1365824 RepID=UPI001CEA97CE|nr:uncharacterized protein PSEUBRA_005977 [Kalmanozyma brasiliensis GHG001]EST04699.2 hypothetical protein PSEUBRA_005977 [Kalmanozyma brasiliensis GHG001]
MSRAESPPSPSRRGLTALLQPLLVTLLITLLFTTSPSHGLSLAKRDAFTDVRGTIGDHSLTTVGRRPPGAYARTLPITPTTSIFTWYSKTPRDESDATSAFIVVHGVARNANTYWSILNNAYTRARNASLGSADVNSIRVAPLFFSTLEDVGAYNETHLAWGDSNAWTAGEGSTNPPLSGISSYAVLDSLLLRFANPIEYPNMKTITFVAHGGGAQMLQRYAMLGLPNPNDGRLSIRYVVGDPSSQLYLTQDRPVGVDTVSCPTWNDFRYGLRRSTAAYGIVSPLVAPALFRSYAAKDVRYVVGLGDTDSEHGDQTCMAHAVGGPKRRNRNLAYWKYLNLLSATRSPEELSGFPGSFPALDPTVETNQTDIPTSTAWFNRRFRGVQLTHTLTLVPGAGHSASKVYGSDAGRNALFADQESSGSGSMPDYSQELVGYTADAEGAKDYSDQDDDDDD